MYCLENFCQLEIKIIKKILILTSFLLLLSNACYSKNQSGISSAHPKATNAGIDILKIDGNAFDAAIAVASTLSVVEPFGSGIGGGGFFLFYLANEDRHVFIDARETSPMLSNEQMFDDTNGNYSRSKALNSPISAAIPGLPAAMAHIAQKYGQLPLTVSMAESINIAQLGFKVSERYRRMARYRLECLKQFEDSSEIFLDNEQVPPLGFVIKQPSLAETLRVISIDPSEFYNGTIAEEMVASVNQSDGIWKLNDLKSYIVKEREPIIENFKGIKFVSAPPPSSGGIVLAQTLKILEDFDLSNFSESDRVHLIVEAMKKGYRDRAKYLGDPDFSSIDSERLLSSRYIDTLRQQISLVSASESEDLSIYKKSEGNQTTHFSILDSEGNIASVTLSINYPFGSCFVAGKTGVLLNNEMDDFSVGPGIPNAYGLVGLEPNSIEPNKRPLSSMTPTILESKKKKAVLGTPGGSRIISMVLLSTLEFIKGNEPKIWVSTPRYHHQFLPNKIQFEEGAFAPGLKKRLVAKGHKLQELNRLYGNMQSILLDKNNGEVTTASDPRGEGSSIVID